MSKYQKGELVYWYNEGYPSLAGLHSIQEIGNDGIYRIVDRDGNFTDVEEEELKPTRYHVFVTIPSGLPIIVPSYLPQFKEVHDKIHVFEHIFEGTADECIRKQVEVLDKMIIIPRQS